jgi:hypothetical protein
VVLYGVRCAPRHEDDIPRTASMFAIINHERAGAIEDIEELREVVRLRIHPESVVVLRLPHVDPMRRQPDFDWASARVHGTNPLGRWED